MMAEDDESALKVTVKSRDLTTEELDSLPDAAVSLERRAVERIAFSNVLQKVFDGIDRKRKGS